MEQPKQKSIQNLPSSIPRAIMVKKLKITSIPTQTLFRRNFERTDAALFWLDQVMEKVSEDADMEKAIQHMWDQLDDVKQRLKAEADTAEKLITDNDLSELDIRELNSVEIEVPCQVPESLEIIEIFQMHDQVCAMVDRLRFGAVYDRRQKKQVEDYMRKTIKGLCQMIITTNTRATQLHKEMKNKGGTNVDGRKQSRARRPQKNKAAA